MGERSGDLTDREAGDVDGERLVEPQLRPGPKAQDQPHQDNRDDVAQATPGVFRESKQSDRVYFVEHVNGSENLVANVFGFKSEGDFFSVPPSVRDVPNVDFATL